MARVLHWCYHFLVPAHGDGVPPTKLAGQGCVIDLRASSVRHSHSGESTTLMVFYGWNYCYHERDDRSNEKSFVAFLFALWFGFVYVGVTVALGLRVNTILSISIVGSEVLRIRQNFKGLIPIVKKGNMKPSLLNPKGC